MYAQRLAEGMKEKMRAGMSEAERTQFSNRLLGIVDKAQADEGEVKHFLLLALGRVWQVDPRQGPMDSEAAVESRKQVVAKLLGYLEAAPISAQTEDERVRLKGLQNRVRNAAALALAFMSGRPEARAALPALTRILGDTSDDLDVRMSASAAIGQIATPQDTAALEALRTAKNRTDKKEEIELVWSAAIALAQLNQGDAEGEVMKLLSRAELDQAEYFDRETDPKNPRFRKLSEPEKERILINAMIGGIRLQVPEVQAQIRNVAQSDPSGRVREAGRLVLAGKDAGVAAAALKPTN
jgi:HEAT repeat protein